MKMKTRPFTTTAFITICFLWPLCCAFSATPEEEALKQRVVALEAIVADLQSRLSKLEAPTTRNTPTVAPENNAQGWKDKANWRNKLSKGMSKDAVIQLFGEPRSISTANDLQMFFYGSGYVAIDDKRGVISWAEARTE
jgi:hypothetical protein